MNEAKMSRRSFLRGSIALGVGTAGMFALTSCAPRSAQSASSASSAASAASSSAASASAAAGSGKVTLHRGYGAAHGTKCFTQAVIATAEDGTIVAADIDDYQFGDITEGWQGVPNSDADLAQSWQPDVVLFSKKQNSDKYSAEMKQSKGATQTWLQSMEAIQKYLVGKKPSDLASVSLDAVSGATLVDTPKYVALAATVAQSTDLVSDGSFSGNASDLKIGQALSAAHGTKAFASAVSLVQGSTLVATSIDEFQAIATTTSGLKPVPNSDADFGANYADGVELCSKAQNSDVYSEGMKSKNGATQTWLQSIQAIEKFCAGKNVSDVKADGLDAVSGATLVDTSKYVAAANEAAQAAK
jgi:hypothetical protein